MAKKITTHAGRQKKRSGKKVARILFLTVIVVLAAAFLLVRFPPRITDGAWHDESRVVMIARGVLYGAAFALIVLIASEGLGNAVLLLPAPVAVGALPVFLAIVGIVYGFKAAPNQYLILDGATYTLEDGKVCMEKWENPSLSSFSIPNEVEGYPLLYIGNRCFRNASVETVTVPGSVTGVGKKAFAGSELKKIVFDGNKDYSADSVALMSGVFKNCKSLQTVICHRSRIELDSNTFRGCKSLETVYIGGNLQNMGSTCRFKGDGVFLGCPALKAMACSNIIFGSRDKSNPFIQCPQVVLYCDSIDHKTVVREVATDDLSAYRGAIK